MKGDSDITEDMEETQVAEVTDDSCTVQFIEIVPLDTASHDYQTPAFVNPVVDVKPEDLLSVKQEPADESDSEAQCFSVKVTLAYAVCYCLADVLIQHLLSVTLAADIVSQLK